MSLQTGLKYPFESKINVELDRVPGIRCVLSPRGTIKLEKIYIMSLFSEI